MEGGGSWRGGAGCVCVAALQKLELKNLVRPSRDLLVSIVLDGGFSWRRRSRIRMRRWVTKTRAENLVRPSLYLLISKLWTVASHGGGGDAVLQKLDLEIL